MRLFRSNLTYLQVTILIIEERCPILHSLRLSSNLSTVPPFFPGFSQKVHLSDYYHMPDLLRFFSGTSPSKTEAQLMTHTQAQPTAEHVSSTAITVSSLRAWTTSAAPVRCPPILFREAFFTTLSAMHSAILYLLYLRRELYFVAPPFCDIYSYATFLWNTGFL